MKNILIAAFVFTVIARAASAVVTGMMPTVDPLGTRIQRAIDRAADICPGIARDIDRIKIMAGVGIAGSAVGAVTGVVALHRGIKKWQADDNIRDLGITLEALRAARDTGDRAAVLAMLNNLADIQAEIEATEQAIGAARIESQRLGNSRTNNSLISGGAQAVSATATLGGADSLGNTIINIEVCSSAINDIQAIVNEMIMANSYEIALIERGQNIIRACRGMDAENIAVVRGRLRTAGIVSVIGTAAGITGGVTSAIAVNREAAGASATDGEGNTRGLNLAANISAGAAAGAGIGGAILSGTALAGLIKNGNIANACAEALR